MVSFDEPYHPSKESSLLLSHFTLVFIIWSVSMVSLTLLSLFEFFKYHKIKSEKKSKEMHLRPNSSVTMLSPSAQAYFF
jgi:hypothetical protein